MRLLPMELKPRSPSIRGYLILLVLACVLPAAAGFVWFIAHESRQATETAYGQVRIVAQDVAGSLDLVLRDYEALLGRIAERPRVKTLDARKCDPILGEYVRLHPEFITIAVRDPAANAICWLLPNPPTQEQAIGFQWFREGMRSGKFLASNAFQGLALRRWLSVLTHPIRDDAGQVSGLLILPLDLLGLNRRLLKSVPGNMLVAVLDREDRFLMRSLDPAMWIGKPLPDAQTAVIRDLRGDSFSATGADGVKRLYVVATVPAAGWRVVAGVPEDEAFAAYRALLARGIAIGAALLALMLAMAYGIASAIVKPVRHLARTVAKIAVGDSNARAHIAGPLELEAVARQFNHMLDVAQQGREALQESERRYRLLFESSPWPMWVFDTETLAFLAVNNASVQAYGYARDEFMAMTIEEIRPAEDVARLREWLRVRADAPQRNGQSRHMKKNGQVIDVEVMSHLVDFFGRQARLVLANDISERLAAEAAGNQIEAQLRQVQKMEAIGTLAGGIAHDFNNILAAILGNVALARKDLGAGHAALVSLDEIDKAGTRAKHLVRQILAFSRRQPQNLVNQNLQPLVEETLGLLRATLPAGVELAATLGSAPLYVRADATQIQQVLMNLCTNAWHALKGSAGRIAVGQDQVVLGAETAQRLGALVPGRYARLWVSDNGCGMDEATQARIFEPFFTTKAVGQGTGLGMAVVHGIIKAHHGAIAVESAPGKGTTFEVFLPAVETPMQTLQPAVPAAPARASGCDRHVLYVDDDEAMVFLVTRLLQDLGYRVSGYEQAQAALEAVRANPENFDLVVTDFNMPGFSGLDVARELMRVRPELPVVITSGYITAELQAGAQAAGVRQIVYKPNTVEELCQNIQRLLEST